MRPAEPTEPRSISFSSSGENGVHGTIIGPRGVPRGVRRIWWSSPRVPRDGFYRRSAINMRRALRMPNGGLWPIAREAEPAAA